MQCLYCKKQVPSDALICPHCGKPLVLDATLLPKDLIVEKPDESIKEEPIIEEQVVAEEHLPEEEVLEEQSEEPQEEPASEPKKQRSQKEKRERPRKENDQKKKPKHQFGKSVLILLLTVLSICGFILLKVVTPDAAVNLINQIKANTTLKIINYLLLFIPTLLIFILGQLGWGLIVILAGVAILSSLLVMIKATKTKKFLLLGIIALNVALIISAIIMYWH